MIRRPAQSLQDVPIIISVPVGNPINDLVQMAFTLGGTDPQPADWQTASWVPISGLPPGDYLAQCLVGPGGTIALPAGDYYIWAKVTDNPEIPVLPAGILKIY